MINRYDPETHWSGYPTGNMERCDDGAWVQYEDYERLVKLFSELDICHKCGTTHASYGCKCNDFKVKKR